MQGVSGLPFYLGIFGPEAFRTSYDYTGDFQCSHCSGYWSTWVKFDLTSGKRKWMTPGTAYADDMWFCGLAKCLASCKAEENRRRAAKTATQVPSRSKRKALASIQQPQAQAKKKKSSQRCQLSKENTSRGSVIIVTSSYGHQVGLRETLRAW